MRLSPRKRCDETYGESLSPQITPEHAARSARRVNHLIPQPLSALRIPLPGEEPHRLCVSGACILTILSSIRGRRTGRSSEVRQNVKSR